MTTALTEQTPAGTPEGVKPQENAPVGQSNEVAKPPVEGAPEGTKTPEGAKPVEYTDFTVPEGMALDTEVLGEFKEFAKAKNLTQEEAQSLINLQTKLADKQQGAWNNKLKEWATASESDKEFGGVDYKANIATAKKALETFGTPELKDILNASGQGNNPEVIRFFYRVGKAIGTDKIMGSGQGGAEKKSAAELLYPTMNK